MNTDVYGICKEFLRRHPGTIAWRLKKHSKVIQRHLNDDEVVLFSFAGQKNTNTFQPFYTTVIVFTNKRMLLGQRMFLGRSHYTSITPDMLNDFEIRTGILYGSVEIDTIKEHFTIGCLSKSSLPAIEDALSKYMVNEKLKYMQKDS